MKTKKWLYYTLMLLPLAATLIALPLLPTRYPPITARIIRWTAGEANMSL